MTTGYAERYDEMLAQAYGPFTPGSLARAVRADNALLGLRTCWFCLAAFAPRRVVDETGRVRRLGRGRFFCSSQCAAYERRRAARERSIVTANPDGSFTIDLRRCWDCAA